MISPNVETFIGCDSSYRAADIVLYGAPFDSTTSYRPGARFGPSAIRHESFGLETYSPYQNADLTDFDIFDSGFSRCTLLCQHQSADRAFFNQKQSRK